MKVRVDANAKPDDTVGRRSIESFYVIERGTEWLCAKLRSNSSQLMGRMRNDDCLLLLSNSS